MKYSIIIILLFFSFSAVAQCNYIQNETDEFTGDVKVATSATIDKNFMGPVAFFFFKKINDNYYLMFQKSYTRAQSFYIPEGSELMLKLMNDSIVNLEAAENYRAEITTTGAGNITVIKPTYQISEESIEMIRRFPPQKYRLYLHKDYLEDEIKQKHWKEISTAAKCILKATG